jgi:hypothetical protein
MTLELPANLQEKIAETHTDHTKRHTMFATLSNADLATSAQFWMQHCRIPKHVEPGIPVWDSTFWHIIVPEMIRRLLPDNPDRTAPETES